MSKALRIIPALLVIACFTVGSVLAAGVTVKLKEVDPVFVQQFYMAPRLGYKSEKEKGKVCKYGCGATMTVGFVLDIKNDGKEPVMLDELAFKVYFDGIQVNSALAEEDAWIPAGKSNEVRTVLTFDAFPTLVSCLLSASNSAKIKEMGVKPAALLKKWWTSLADGSFEVSVKGDATFLDAKGKETKAPIEGTWGKAAKAAKK